MADSTAVIEIIRRIVADDTADLRERVQHLEQKALHPIDVIGATEPPEYSQASMEDPGLGETVKALQERLDQIKGIHRLDATPVQWTRNNSGQMVEAPDGLWEISCVACTYTTTYRDGDDKPTPCPTWRIADGQNVG